MTARHLRLAAEGAAAGLVVGCVVVAILGLLGGTMALAVDAFGPVLGLLVYVVAICVIFGIAAGIERGAGREPKP